MPDSPRPGGTEERGNRGRIALGVIAVAVVLLALSLRAIATFWTDYLWFAELDFTNVWTRVLSAKATLWVATSLVFFVLLWSNLVIADRLAPRFRLASGPDDELLVRYRELVAGRQRLVWLVVAVLISIIPGFSASSRWQDWVLFRYGGTFGTKDAQFDTDLGWYLFKLPFLSAVVDWLFAFLIATAIAVAIVHYLNGAIRSQSMGERVTPNAKAQLSVLLALAAFTKAVDYWLQRFELVTSDGRAFDGAGYAEINATLPAIRLMMLISVFAGVLLLANIRRKGWTLPVIIVGLWAVVGVLAGSLYPAFVQRFQVEPAELAKERPYIERNITATRAALGISDVGQVPFDYSPRLDAATVAEQPENLDNARLLDPYVIQPTIQDLQVEREYYRFQDVDVDRYDIADNRTPVIISSRELNLAGVTAPTWEKLHLVFTHGYGAALAPANRVDDRGEPEFLVGGIPPRSIDLPPLTRPEIYVGEKMTGYSIVGTKQRELSDDDVSTTYVGTGGVSIGSTIRRAAFALRFGQIEPLISDSVTAESKVIYNRDAVDRVRQVAPFLQTDPDPYPVLLDGRVQYIVDGYTLSSNYPYAEAIDASQIDEGASGSFNYLRNSVKALVDSYDGTVTLYLTDELSGEPDPIIRAYAKAFPGLFETEVPEEVSEHFRYPEFLFKTQTTMWGRYHQSDPSTFFNNSDRWIVAPAPTDRGVGSDSEAENPTEGPMEPYYQEMKIGSAEQSEFVLTRPFVLSSGDGTGRNLTSVMIARNDPGSYGRLEEIIMVSGEGDDVERNTSVKGPVQANRQMVAYDPLREYQTFVGRAGTKVRYGNLLILPVGNSLVYLRPIYAAEESSSSRFTMKRVVVSSGDSSGFGESVEAAIADMLDADPDAATASPEEGPAEPSGSDEPAAEVPEGASAGELLRQADERLDRANKALGEQDLAAYQRLVNEAAELIRSASRLLDGSTAASGESAPADSPSDGADAPTTTVPADGG